MLEIIALIFIARKFGKTAELKGLPKGTWRLYGILSFAIPTYTLVFLIAFMTGEIGIALLGYVVGIVSCIVVYNVLKNKPAVMADTTLFGQTEEDTNFEKTV